MGSPGVWLEALGVQVIVVVSGQQLLGSTWKEKGQVGSSWSPTDGCRVWLATLGVWLAGEGSCWWLFESSWWM